MVAAAAGGVPEVVQQGETGLLVPFGAVEGLADALDSLLTNPRLAQSMGETGRALVHAGYSWDDRHATLSARIDRLVAHRRADVARAG